MEHDGDVLQVSHVSSSYSGNELGIVRRRARKQILHDVSFSIKRNEFFGLVGESGCGKSTLAKTILELIPHEGTVTVDGKLYTRADAKMFRRTVQAVFQDPMSALDPRKTIGFSLKEVLAMHHVGTRDEVTQKVLEVLDKVGLDVSFMGRYPHELSGGQRQRVCIASALLLSPELIVADEPISSLDISVGAQILNLFQELHRQMELAVLFISHNMELVYYLCDRIAVMYKGRIVELGSADDVYYHPRHPYTELLLRSLGGEYIPMPSQLVPSTSLACCYYERCPYREERCLQDVPLLFVDEKHCARCWRIDRG